MRKVLALLLSVVMALSLMVTTAWADPVEQDLAGKTVILHTNDVHGEIARYAKVAALKAELQQGRRRRNHDECRRLRSGHHRQPRV